MAGENGEKPGIEMGALVKRYREDRGATQRGLAAAAGMSLGALRDLEQGRTRSPRWGTLEELTAVLGLGQAERAELVSAWRAAAGSGQPARHNREHGRTPGVRISVLGPLTAWRHGAPVALGSARQRAVLGLLALHAGAGVHRDMIVDLLWGQRPAPSAVAKVQSYVSRLRGLLGDGSARTGNAELVTTAGGCCYRLNTSAGGLDLTAFGALIRQAEQAAGRSDQARACDRYEDALRLWHGDILTDVGLLREHPATVRVTCRRADAVINYARAAAQTGAHGRALPHLRDLCARDGLNERAHACLMIALAATGQQVAALDVFAGLRRRLNTELGIAPSPVLARAHAEVLRPHPGPETPDRGRASRYLFTGTHSELRTE
jgi:DNA-binding SARP family transcriptional activator